MTASRTRRLLALAAAGAVIALTGAAWVDGTVAGIVAEVGE